MMMTSKQDLNKQNEICETPFPLFLICFCDKSHYHQLWFIFPVLTQQISLNVLINARQVKEETEFKIPLGKCVR